MMDTDLVGSVDDWGKTLGILGEFYVYFNWFQATSISLLYPIMIWCFSHWHFDTAKGELDTTKKNRFETTDTLILGDMHAPQSFLFHGIKLPQKTCNKDSSAWSFTPPRLCHPTLEEWPKEPRWATVQTVRQLSRQGWKTQDHSNILWKMPNQSSYILLVVHIIKIMKFMFRLPERFKRQITFSSEPLGAGLLQVPFCDPNGSEPRAAQTESLPALQAVHRWLIEKESLGHWGMG